MRQSCSAAICLVATLGAKMVVKTAHFVQFLCPATAEYLLRGADLEACGESNSRLPEYARVRTAENLGARPAVSETRLGEAAARATLWHR